MTGVTIVTTRAGGRPAEVFRFRDTQLAITDPFAALRMTSTTRTAVVKGHLFTQAAAALNYAQSTVSTQIQRPSACRIR